MNELERPHSDKIFFLALKFLEQEPAAAARLLEGEKPEYVANFLANTPLSLAKNIIGELLPQFGAKLLLVDIVADKGLAGLWLNELTDNHAAAILRFLPQAEQMQILTSLQRKKRSACQVLLNYRADMLGAWVEIDVPIFSEDMDVSECVKRLKRHRFRESRVALLVDSQRQFLGEIAINDLIRSAANLTVSGLKVVVEETISGHMLLSTAIRHPIWQQRDMAVVVNHQKFIIGVIWYSRLRQLLTSHSTWLSSRGSRDGAILDLLQSHGEGMRALFDSIKETLS